LKKVVEKILAEGNEETLCKHIAELEAENSQLATAAAESSETRSAAILWMMGLKTTTC
jgi:hypothetical protein